MDLAENEQLSKALEGAIKFNMRQEIINILSTSPEYNEDNPEVQEFINLWVERAWEIHKQQEGGVKLHSKGGSDNIY